MAAMMAVTLLVALVFLTSTTVLAEDHCVYTVFVKTGWRPRSGTDANIGAAFYTAEGNGIEIANFTGWGNLLEPNKNYFERNALDVFSGFGDCLSGPICKLNLTSDGTGSHHGWFSESVEITAAKFGENCSSHHFTVNEWLATDIAPHSLTFEKDDCVTDDPDTGVKKIRKFGEGR
ncbi:hypothetical protein R1sor_005238 [Riccia sorocarpa]|uniref:PLAT domain-containing protein n=1 Tax=Riccia sorocarpa TaxID=122646 RepID=A0ABD3HMF9_9MARC